MTWKHFKIEEFDCPTEEGSAEKNMCKDFISTLNAVRHSAGVPMVITSGYRTEEHNKSIKGAKKSSHLIGVAADISCTNSVDRLKIVEAALKHKVRRIGIADTFIHLDVDRDKPACIWLY